LEANRQLRQMQVADYPNLKSDARSRVFKALQKQAQSYEVTGKSKDKKKLSNEELFRMIQGR